MKYVVAFIQNQYEIIFIKFNILIVSDIILSLCDASFNLIQNIYNFLMFFCFLVSIVSIHLFCPSIYPSIFQIIFSFVGKNIHILFVSLPLVPPINMLICRFFIIISVLCSSENDINEKCFVFIFSRFFLCSFAKITPCGKNNKKYLKY